MSLLDSDNPDKIYHDLAAKWLDGSISPEEKEKFLEWYNTLPDEPVLIPASFAASREVLRNRMLQKIRNEVQAEKKTLRFRMRFDVAIASLLIMIAGAGLYYYLVIPAAKKWRVQPPVAQVKTEDSRAILTLSDGSSIVLDESSNGTVASQGLAKVIKLGNGQLKYVASGAGGTDQQIGYNTISTPKGGQYEIILPDNSKVWLNASSSLRFPTAFTSKERNVELNGEGYFEVAKDKRHPFKIKVNDLNVTVLGTHFNIMAYEEEAEVNTTLLEGSVKVERGNEQALLKPGEQAALKKDNGSLAINKNVNIEQVVAWMSGEFCFENAKVETIMRQIERWHDVTVEYDKNIQEIGLSGSLSRSNSVPELLEILEATHRIHFTRNGNKIIVSANRTK